MILLLSLVMGRENYQILKNETIHFDDREEARKLLRRSNMAEFTLQEIIDATSGTHG